MNNTPRYPPGLGKGPDTTAPVKPNDPMASGASEAIQKKRNRTRFSCTTCREKKLKCNRGQPCDQCVKRNIETACVYVPFSNSRDALRGFPGSSSQRSVRSPPMDANSQERLRHLEHLVAVMRRQLADKGTIPEEVGPSTKSPSVRKGTPRPPGMPETPGDLSGVYEPSPAGALVGDMRFVDAANWEAILDDVTNLTKELKTNDEDGEDEDEFTGLSGPVLLSGSWIQMTMSEIIFDYMPPKAVTDQLIARFFQGKEPAWSMFHIPSFMRQYNEFWEAPHTFSMSWVGLLFIMISHAALFCLRGDEEVPGSLGPPMSVSDVYRIRSAHALALDDFTKPGKWKVEAMILYFGIEYLRLSDAQRGTSILMTMTVRLAMHMGLHRDPTHYREISIYECEMRRRLWTILTEIDLLVAFQFGLPANVQRRYFDTRIPRNILDEDFDESTTEWPPERPKTERTPALYTIVKSRIVVAFGDILSTVTSRHSPTYGEVLRLDKKLEEAHESIPPLLRMRSFSLSVTDPVELIMQRLWIELMYQKARIVLHRRYFTIARGDNRYRYSHFACIDASTMTLQHQFDIHNEMLPGGRLSRDRWFLSSLSTHDFLLANMMLALELSHVMRKDDPERANPEPIDRERLLSIISTSRNIWQSRCEESAEASRAFKILSRMLTISTGVQYDQVPQMAGDETMAPSQRPSYQFAHGMNLQDFGEQHSRQMFEQEAHMIWSTGGAQEIPANMASSQWQNNPSSFAAPMAVPEALIEPGQGIDWSNWDTQILNASAENMEIPWTNFFN